MIYSNATAYAVRALSRLAGSGTEGHVKLRDIADAEGIPYPFLANVFRALVVGDLVKAVRGPGGGYILARSPDEITLLDIRRLIEGVDELESCAVGLDRCSDEMPCPLHDTWKPIRASIAEYLTTTTLADMAAALAEKRADRTRPDLLRPAQA